MYYIPALGDMGQTQQLLKSGDAFYVEFVAQRRRM